MKTVKFAIMLFISLGFLSCSDTKELYKNAVSQTSKKLSPEIFNELPKPVKNYFSYALKKDQSYIDYLRLKHDGSFKSSIHGKWMDIKGEQYFRAQTPGFVWIGKTKMFKAIDSYIDDKGKLSVYLFGFLRIANKKGNTLNQAELLRWLGESVWMPTNLLPDEYITWSAIDDSTAKLSMNYNGTSVYYDVHFNDRGQITKLETQRYMEDTKQKWVGELDNYQRVDGMMLPTNIKASWILDDKKHTYADFYVTEFDFDNPNKY